MRRYLASVALFGLCLDGCLRPCSVDWLSQQERPCGLDEIAATA